MAPNKFKETVIVSYSLVVEDIMVPIFVRNCVKTKDVVPAAPISDVRQ